MITCKILLLFHSEKRGIKS